MTDAPAPADQGDSSAPTVPSAVGDAKELAKEYDSKLAGLRRASDISSKALGVIATTAATALGVTKLSSVFPQPPGVQWGWFVALYGGLAVALGGVVLIAARLWNVGQPIPTQSDLRNMTREASLDEPEERLVHGVYAEAANLHNTTSLLAYEARGYRFERVAYQLQDPDQAPSQLTTNLLAEAARIRAEVDVAQNRAAYLVGRRRAAKVFTDWKAVAAYVLFAVGLIGVSLGNSYLVARSTSPDASYTLAKDCADLAKAAAGAGEKLTIKSCNAVVTRTTSTSTASAGTSSTTTGK